MKSYKVLTIDAWADGEGGWNWNSWQYLPYSFPAELLSDDAALLGWFAEQGLIRSTIGAARVDDDQYNKVVCDALTDEPCFAVEYGSDE